MKNKLTKTYTGNYKVPENSLIILELPNDDRIYIFTHTDGSASVDVTRDDENGDGVICGSVIKSNYKNVANAYNILEKSIRLSTDNVCEGSTTVTVKAYNSIPEGESK